MQVSNSSTITLSVPAGASVLINVHSSSEIEEGYVKLSGALLGSFGPGIADRVIWNFYGV
jgi:choice-of-anchor A domain-containing protein